MTGNKAETYQEVQKGVVTEVFIIVETLAPVQVGIGALLEVGIEVQDEGSVVPEEIEVLGRTGAPVMWTVVPGGAIEVPEEGIEVLEEGKEVLEEGAEVLEEGKEVLEEGTEVLEEGTEVLEEWTEALEGGTEVQGVGTEAPAVGIGPPGGVIVVQREVGTKAQGGEVPDKVDHLILFEIEETVDECTWVDLPNQYLQVWIKFF